MIFTPRPYQVIAEKEICQYYFDENIGDFCYAMATGSGKSLTLSQVSRAIMYEKPLGRILLLAPSKELIEQNYDKITKYFDPSMIGVMSAGVNRFDKNKPLTLATIKTLKNRRLNFYPETIIADECHLIQTDDKGEYRQYINEAKSASKSKVIGLTATPYNANGHWISCGKNPLFSHIMINKECQLRRLIENTWLCPLREVTIPIEQKVSSKDVKKSNLGDYLITDIEKAFNPYLEDRTEKTVLYADELNIKSAMCVTASINHCERVYEKLKSLGQKVSIVHSKSKLRKENVQAFLAGETRFMCTPVALTTGFDAPSLEMIVNFRHVASQVLYVQLGGRGTRTYEYPDGSKKQFCWFLDWTNTVENLGPIDQITGKIPKYRDGATPVKMCVDSCGYVVPVSTRICPNCGYEFPFEVNIKNLLNQASDAPLMEMDTEHLKQVDDWKIEKYTSKAGKESIRIEFIYNKKVVAREYLAFFNESSNVEVENKKPKRIWGLLQRDSRQPPPNSLTAAWWRRAELKMPDSIKLEKRGSRFQLADVFYKNEEVTEKAEIINIQIDDNN